MIVHISLVYFSCHFYGYSWQNFIFGEWNSSKHFPLKNLLMYVESRKVCVAQNKKGLTVQRFPNSCLNGNSYHVVFSSFILMGHIFYPCLKNETLHCRSIIPLQLRKFAPIRQNGRYTSDSLAQT